MSDESKLDPKKLVDELRKKASDMRKIEEEKDWKKSWNISQADENERALILCIREDENWRQVQDMRAAEARTRAKYDSHLDSLEANQFTDKRDYFAISVLNGWLAGDGITGPDLNDTCAKAYVWADAMMEARKPKP